jgi:hypothetical protein
MNEISAISIGPKVQALQTAGVDTRELRHRHNHQASIKPVTTPSIMDGTNANCPNISIDRASIAFVFQAHPIKLVAIASHAAAPRCTGHK